jgi:hypothetical protein
MSVCMICLYIFERLVMIPHIWISGWCFDAMANVFLEEVL